MKSVSAFVVSVVKSHKSELDSFRCLATGFKLTANAPSPKVDDLARFSTLSTADKLKAIDSFLAAMSRPELPTEPAALTSLAGFHVELQNARSMNGDVNDVTLAEQGMRRQIPV